MSPSLRRKEASVLGELPRGAHLCMFYESTDDLLDSVVPFLRIGLENNEFCVWAPPGKPTPEKFRMALERRIPNFDRHLEAGNVVVFDREIYLKGDHFDHLGLMSDLMSMFRSALAKGHKGMRASGDAFWTDTGQWRDFCDYEFQLSKLLKGKPLALLCTLSDDNERGRRGVGGGGGTSARSRAAKRGDWKLVETTPATARKSLDGPKNRSPNWQIVK